MIGVVRLVLVSAVVLVFAGVARAGDNIVPGPWTDTSMCGGDSAVDLLVMPNSFAFSPRCESHCRAARSDCKREVRAQARCFLHVYGDNVSNAYKNCAEITDNRALELLCKAPIKVSADGFKESIHAEADLAIAACDEFGDLCVTACNSIL